MYCKNCTSEIWSVWYSILYISKMESYYENVFNIDKCFISKILWPTLALVWVQIPHLLQSTNWWNFIPACKPVTCNHNKPFLHPRLRDISRHKVISVLCVGIDFLTDPTVLRVGWLLSPQKLSDIASHHDAVCARQWAWSSVWPPAVGTGSGCDRFPTRYKMEWHFLMIFFESWSSCYANSKPDSVGGGRWKWSSLTIWTSGFFLSSEWWWWRGGSSKPKSFCIF